ncbi:MAG: DUF1622 domain-containing protein [Chloroflexota bacterium]
MDQIVGGILRTAAGGLELAGAAIIVVTAAMVLWELGVDLARYRSFQWRGAHRLLGRGLVLGLEFLIGADILRTILAPSLQDVAVLGAIVLLRAILSFSVEYELRHMGDEPGPAEPPE